MNWEKFILALLTGLLVMGFLALLAVIFVWAYQTSMTLFLVASALFTLLTIATAVGLE